MTNPPSLKLIVSQREEWIPLLPFNTVLFPNGILSLKVFERHHINMMLDCEQQSAHFGMALIKTASPSDSHHESVEVGCTASVLQSNLATPDILRIKIKGEQRFRILETKVSGHIIEARIEKIPPDTTIPISSIHLHCAKTLKIIADDMFAKARAEQGESFISPFAHPLQFDEAGWVANRWSEILPIPLIARQKLLELEDVQARLNVIYQYLQQHKILT